MNVCQHAALKSDDPGTGTQPTVSEKEPSITSQTDCLSLCYHVSENSDRCLSAERGVENNHSTCPQTRRLVHGDQMLVSSGIVSGIVLLGFG
ncbi:hypothetical protein DPX16_5561 [Anabarilius grahami]|uniref:Uncharacterized protein n=1 Tax=Anabarilius grahami TaxID=495550 RepID=A0A3N0YB69_ANAGA|nr:hypothetical protein DPX16_5561 [Anabarilius grahami]